MGLRSFEMKVAIREHRVTTPVLPASKSLRHRAYLESDLMSKTIAPVDGPMGCNHRNLIGYSLLAEAIPSYHRLFGLL